MADEDTFNYTSASLSVILSIITIVLNSFCIDVVRRSKVLLRKPSTVFILNLLVLQLIQGLIVLPLYVVEKSNFHGDEQWRVRICNGFRFSYTITFFGTCLGVLLTSVDRFFAVYWIASYRFRLTRPRVLTILLIKWIYIVTLCALPLFNTSRENEIVVSCHGRMDVACDYHPSKLWSILMLGVNTALPYVIIVAVYIYVTRTVKYFEKRAHHQKTSSKYVEVPLENNRGVIKLKKKDIAKHKKITKLAITLCLAYALLWLPSVVYYAIKHLCPECFHTISCSFDYFDYFVKFVAFLNGILVPVVYCFYQKDFRRSAGNRNAIKTSITDIEKVKLLSEDVL